jgi:dTDP-4-dehydrorhamnose reductase
MKKNIVITGGNGRFGSVLKKINSKNDYLFPDKRQLNILKLNSVKNY